MAGPIEFKEPFKPEDPKTKPLESKEEKELESIARASIPQSSDTKKFTPKKRIGLQSLSDTRRKVPSPIPRAVEKQAPLSVLKSWRSDTIPTLCYDQLQVDLTGVPERLHDQVKKECLGEYQKANQAFDKAIGRTCMHFIRKEGAVKAQEAGPLLEFSRAYSHRYLSLYKAYVTYEMKRGIPFISNSAGQLKNCAFTSVQIIKMQSACKEFCQLSTDIFSEILKRQPNKVLAEEEYSLFLKLLTSKDPEEKEILQKKYAPDPVMSGFIEEYQKMEPEKKEAIEKAFFMMLRFQHMSVSDAISQLEAITSVQMGDAINRFNRSYLVAGCKVSEDQYEALLNSSKEFQGIFQEIETYFLQNGEKVGKEKFEEFITLLITQSGFDAELIARPSLDPKLKHLIEKFSALPNKELLLASLKEMSKDKPTISHIQKILQDVGNTEKTLQAEFEERLLMEIRHRVGGDGSYFQEGVGSIGQNPLGYINCILNGDPDGNLEAEFRQQMYFVYMSNHFANQIMTDPDLTRFVNQELEKEGEDWRINPDFLTAMNERGPQYMGPIFRYGIGAQLNTLFREGAHHDDQEQYYQRNKTPTFGELLQGTAPLHSNFLYNLSRRELLNQFGEIDPLMVDPDKAPTFESGAALFRLKKPKQITETGPKADAARQYLKMVKDLRIPTAAGISGTLDQSTAMAGLVGIGTSDDPKRREDELQTIKRAFLAFMIPNSDHSSFEVMFSAHATYGLPCHFGPGFERDIDPKNPAFLKMLEEEQKKQGFELPEFYLSRAFALKVALKHKT